MLILNRPGFKIILSAPDDKITYPAQASINFELSPPDMFGLTPLSGKLAFSPVGATLTVDVNRFRGAGRIISSGQYPRMHFQSTYLGHPFFMDGNNATFKTSISRLEELYTFIEHVESIFPALFSGILPAPIDVISIRGTLQEFPFEAYGNMPSSNSSYCTDKELDLKPYFDQYAPQTHQPATPLIAAFRYLQQADKLEYSGHHTTTFLPERILNLAKSLESLFPGDNGITRMRELMSTWKIKSEYVELFATLRHLRNQVDVGHVGFTDLPPGVVAEIHSFTETATKHLRTLLTSLLRNISAQDEITKLRKSETSPKIPDAIKYLKRHENLRDSKTNDLTEFSPTKESNGDVGCWLRCQITESAAANLSGPLFPAAKI